ncbi:oxidoreductase, molybdopterin-binding protein, partial [Pseudomonas syringae pv. actinidiae ICMP 18804]
PVSALAEEMLVEGEGQVRALVTVAGNPVLSTPNGRQLDQALEGLEFMLSIDLYINETTRHADLILPSTSALENDHYDTTFNTL